MTQPYYMIKSRLTGFVLEPESGGLQPNARVTPVDANGRDSQIWYDCQSTGTLRNKANNFCLDIEGELLVVRPYQQGDPNQQWMRVDKYIKNRVDQNRVLDIFSNSRDRGAKIGAWKFHGGDNQSWDFDFVGGNAPISGSYAQVGASTYPGYPGSGGSGYPAAGSYPQPGYPAAAGGYPQSGYPTTGGNQQQQVGAYPGYPQSGGSYPQGGGYPSQGSYPQTSYPASGGSTSSNQPRREFFIVSTMHGKVLDIEKGKKEAGTKIIVWDKHSSPNKNQLWYEDGHGFIHSALNDMTFTSTPNDTDLSMQPATNDTKSQWKFDGEKIVNKIGECLDIKGADKDRGTKLCGYKYQNSKNQHWRQEFI